MKTRILVAILLVLSIPLFTTNAMASEVNELVTVCHNPGTQEVTIKVAALAVNAHKLHGDSVGYPCGTVFAQCTDQWSSEFTDTEKTYVLEVDKDFLRGRATHIRTINRADESLQVYVTSLTTGNTWSFSTPACRTECEYLLGWYGGTTNSIGDGTGVYKIEITQEQDGLVRLTCVD